MARNKKSAYGAPREGKEVVVTVDRRVLYGVGLVVAFIVAIGLGMAWTRLGGSSGVDQPDAAEESSDAVAAGSDELTEADIRATAMAEGLPTTVVVVPGFATLPASTPEAASDEEAAGSSDASEADPYSTVRARITPVSTEHADLLEDPNTIPFEIEEDFDNPAAGWPPDVLANFEDPNVTNPDYAPLRYETVEGVYEGPRLAVSDLNELNTFNYGVVELAEPIEHEFEIHNVGDEELIISRIYSACGCTATRIGDTVIDPAGFIQPSGLVLKPGETIKFGVEFDPRAEGVAGTQAKYVQLFTNDPSGAIFDTNDPNSHETRFRLVVAPQ